MRHLNEIYSASEVPLFDDVLRKLKPTSPNVVNNRMWKGRIGKWLFGFFVALLLALLAR